MGDIKYKAQQPPNAENGSFAPLRREDFHQLCAYLPAYPEASLGVMIYPEAAPCIVAASSATKCVRVLAFGDCRGGIFTFAPERSKSSNRQGEELFRWVSSWEHPMALTGPHENLSSRSFNDWVAGGPGTG